MKHFQKNKGLSLRSAVGFSLPELMVVVIIISGLALLGIPTYRKFVANARRGEATATLSTIHKLQVLHQQGKDNFAEWTETVAIGYRGAGATGCTWGTDGEVATKDGAESLGFKPTGCENMRYKYWIAVGASGGKEDFLAIAYAISDGENRIYPTCDGNFTARGTTIKVTHPETATLTWPSSNNLRGDLLAIDEEKRIKRYMTDDNDIIKACEEN